jgi:hypothetical protein
VLNDRAEIRHEFSKLIPGARPGRSICAHAGSSIERAAALLNKGPPLFSKDDH